MTHAVDDNGEQAAESAARDWVNRRRALHAAFQLLIVGEWSRIDGDLNDTLDCHDRAAQLLENDGMTPPEVLAWIVSATPMAVAQAETRRDQLPPWGGRLLRDIGRLRSTEAQS